MKVGRVDETCRHDVLSLFARLKPQPAWVDPVAYHVFLAFVGSAVRICHVGISRRKVRGMYPIFFMFRCTLAFVL